MKEHPIIFSAPMVRALLDGSKTQTRRGVKGAEKWPANAVRAAVLETRGTAMAIDAQRCSYGPEIKCPYGCQPGDRLWVRETWRTRFMFNRTPPRDISPMAPIHFEAGGAPAPGDGFWGQLRPGIFMPRWASRITLEVTGVRVERLQSISEADAKAEGAMLSEGPCTEPEFQSYTLGYLNLWNSINGPGSWYANPWVWIIEFRRVS